MNLETGKLRFTKLKHKEKIECGGGEEEQGIQENFPKLMNNNKPQVQEV